MKEDLKLTPEAIKAMETSNGLMAKMLDPETGLMTRIKALEEKGVGVGDLKEQVQKMSEDNAKAIDEMNAEAKKLNDRLDETEAYRGGQKGVGGGDPYAQTMKSLSEAGMASGKRGEKFIASMDVSNVFRRKAVTALSNSGGDAIIPVYEPEIIAPGQQGITLLDVLPRTNIQSPYVFWVTEVLGSRTNGAAIQSLDFTGTGQGVAFGTSDFVFNQHSAETRTFGHTAKIAVQMLDDVAQLRGYIENQMRYMVRFDLENQILDGDNTGKNINGLKQQATAYDVTLDNDLAVANLQMLDVIRLAIHQCRLTFFPATAVILHPDQATQIELLKDGENRYLWVNPMMGNAPRPWGVPIVDTTQQTTGEFTVGAMNHVEVAVRQEVETLLSTENDTDFEKHLATIKAYGRFGLKAYRPTSIIDGAFATALG